MSTVAIVERPGLTSGRFGSVSSSAIRTATRCTILVKLPVAFSGGMTLKTAPVAGARLNSLTIPAVAVTNVVLNKQLEVGLSSRDALLLALTLFLSVLTFASGRTNILAGLIHLLVFATFLFLVFIP